MNHHIKRFGALCIISLLLTGCASKNTNANTGSASRSEFDSGNDSGNPQEGAEHLLPELQAELTFVDAHGEWHTVESHNDWPRHDYQTDAFVMDGGRMQYLGDDYSFQTGIDVSKYQGTVDWNKVKADGIDFAFVRIGFRGYGQTGNIVEDPYGITNVKGAIGAGLDVGCYFFSQAINEEEAREEARFVINLLEKNGITTEDMKMPIVFDPESILGDDARTDNVTGEQFTRNTLAFCDEVTRLGYQGMIYTNFMWEAYQLDLGLLLKEMPLWYADYEATPQTPYAFEIWQYSEKGKVNGVKGAVDLNIRLIRK